VVLAWWTIGLPPSPRQSGATDGRGEPVLNN